MKLLSVTVENYRVHRQTTVEFDPARTLIGGEQEAGKSTLVEAIHHALFLRSRVTGSVHRSMLSDLHQGHPAVTLSFESGGRRYTIRKEFAGGASASTTLSDEGPAEAANGSGGRVLRGEEAENRIHEILQAEELGGGRGLENRLRMQWAHLWVWQGSSGDDPVARANEDRPSEQLRDRLSRLEGGGVLESPRDAAVAREINARQAATFRDNGGVRAGSDLAAAGEACEGAKAAVTEAAAIIESLDQAVDTIDATSRAIHTTDAAIDKATDELAAVRGKLREAAGLRVTIAEEQATADTAELAYAEIVEADREITACEQQISQLDTSLAPAAEQLRDRYAAETASEQAVADAAAKVEATAGHQAEAAAAVAIAELREQLARLRVEREGLAGRCCRIDDLRKEARRLQQQLAEEPAITAENIASLDRLERARDTATATLKAIATKIELLSTAQGVTLGDELLEPGRAVTITSEAELALGPGGDACRLRISPGGGHSLAATSQAKTQAERELAEALAALGLRSTDEARRCQARRHALQTEHHATTVAIAGLGGDEAAEQLTALDAEITRVCGELRRRQGPSQQPPADTAAAASTPTPSAAEALAVAQNEATRAEEARDAAASAAAAAQGQLTAARAAHEAATRARQQAEEALRASRGTLESLKARRGLLVERFGEDRSEAIASRSEARRLAAEALAGSREKLNSLAPESLDRDVQRLERSLHNLREGREQAEARRSVARERLRHEGIDDPRENLARASAACRLAEARLATARREAEAVRLLAELFAAKKREVESQFVAPLASRVADYLQTLFGRDATVAIEYSDGRFTSLTLARPDRGNIAWEFEKLSAGTREQVAAAFRLAMAELLAAGHGGSLPVVFDDAFSSSDARRHQGLQRLLDLAASRGLQIILLSCEPEKYAGLGAVTHSLDQPTASPRS